MNRFFGGAWIHTSGCSLACWLFLLPTLWDGSFVAKWPSTTRHRKDGNYWNIQSFRESLEKSCRWKCWDVSENLVPHIWALHAITSANVSTSVRTCFIDGKTVVTVLMEETLQQLIGSLSVPLFFRILYIPGGWPDFIHQHQATAPNHWDLKQILPRQGELSRFGNGHESRSSFWGSHMA